MTLMRFASLKRSEEEQSSDLPRRKTDFTCLALLSIVEANYTLFSGRLKRAVNKMVVIRLLFYYFLFRFTPI